MSSDTQKEKVDGEEKKKTRRTRKDDDGRDFFCPCGKSYLSYPALYTHIKTKHNGKTPPSTLGSSAIKIQINEELADRNSLDSIIEELHRFLGQVSIENDKQFFPSFTPEEQEYLESISKSWLNTEDHENDGYTYTLSINTIFGRFLQEIKQKIKPEGYHYLCSLILHLKQGINKEKQSPAFCQENSGNQLPILFNSMIMNDHLISSERTPATTLMNHKVLLLKILFFFGNWLYNERYTNYRVKFNSR